MVTILVLSLMVFMFTVCTPGTAPFSDLKATQAEAIRLLPTASTAGINIYPFDDVRYMDLSGLKSFLDVSLMETLWFSENTIWSDSNNQAIALEVLEKGKNPGLGVRALHDQGIT